MKSNKVFYSAASGTAKMEDKQYGGFKLTIIQYSFLTDQFNFARDTWIK